MPSAGNQTFGNLGSDLRRRTLRAIELEKFWCFDQFPASVFTCVCLSGGGYSGGVWKDAQGPDFRTGQVPGFIQKEGSIFCGFALLGIS